MNLLEHHVDEIGLRRSVKQGALARSTADRRQDRRRALVDRGETRPTDSQWKEISADAVATRGVDDHRSDASAVVFDWNRHRDLGGDGPRILVSEPPPFGHEAR